MQTPTGDPIGTDHLDVDHLGGDPIGVDLIGVEEHWVHDGIDTAQRRLPTDLRDDSLVLNEHGGAMDRLTDLGPGRLAVMDQQGVTMQILSLAPPGTQGLDAAEAVALSRAANDVVADTVAAAPDRYRAMATLPLADPTAAAEELRRAAGRGLVGAMVHGRTGDVLLDDPRFDDLWTVAAELGQPVFVHPQIPPRTVRAASYSGLGAGPDLALATFGWGWHLEAGTAALRLMASGVLDRHPALQLVLGHWGELLLFWHDRADGVARMAGLQRSVTEYLRENVWITASGMLDAAMLRHALTVTTPDRLLFSTDHPFQQPTRVEIDAFLRVFPDDGARTAFASGNARRLYRIDGIDA